MKNLFALLFALSTGFAISQTTQTVSGSGSYALTIPCGVTSMTVECWGGGGGGGGSTGATAGSGGGGGGYVIGVVAVTPGATVNFTVGAGGAGGSGAVGSAGGATIFGGLTANGGAGGAANGGAAGSGGSGSGGTSSTSGSAGAVGGASSGGAGGPGGNGGAGGAGGASNSNGIAGTVPGGGGGGSGIKSSGTNKSGGSGAAGQVVLSYNANSATGCDPCHAIPITTFPYTYSGTTTGGFNYMTGGCAGNAPATTGNANDVFFAVTVAANSYLTMQLTGTGATLYNELSVLSGACGGPWSCVANGGWGGGLQTTTGPGSTSPAASSPCRKVWFQNAGTYYIRVDGDAGANGPFSISVNSVTTSGDNCTNAMALSAGSTVGISNTNCQYSLGNDDPSPSSLFCAGTVENTNWFVFQSNGNGSPVNVTVNNVNCQTGYYSPGFPLGSFYSPGGQFGILTGTCGGTFASATTCTNLSNSSSYTTALTNTAVTMYYFVWDGNGGSECSYSISVTNVLPLPIELNSFEVKQDGKFADVTWSTTSESEDSYFIVEKSKDGINFEQAGKVKGLSNSSKKMNYFFQDLEPYPGISYYRLGEMDNSGAVNYTTQRVLNMIAGKKENLIVMPNPSSGDVTLTYGCNGNGSASVMLYDNKGFLLRTLEVNCATGENYTKLETENLEAGMYFIIVNTLDKSYKAKLIKN